jgi:hypothetical protein
LQAVGIPSSIVERILRVRDGEDGQAGTEDDVVFNNFNEIGAKVGLTANDVLLSLVPAQPSLAYRSQVFRVEAEGRSADSRIISRIHAVVSRVPNPVTKQRILAWTEE